MNVLLKSDEIREAVRDVLSDGSDERYAIVAFVGRDPLRWLPVPDGLLVYCWPRAGGTNPDGIDALIKAGAVVHFQEFLHAKVYHGARCGTVVGSANLSHNALGSGRLTETVIRLGPGLFPIDDQLQLLSGAVRSGSDAFRERMDKLRREHVAYYQRNPDTRVRNALRGAVETITFGEWAGSSDDTRQPWQLGAWSGDDDPPADVLEEFQETGGGQFSNWRAHYNSKNIDTHVATLCCQYRKSRWGIIKRGVCWWYPEVKTETKAPEYGDHIHVWFARLNVPPGVSVPFNCNEARFLTALDKAVAEYGDETENLEGPVKGDFLKLLLAYYHE